jgi:hypothetical protein
MKRKAIYSAVLLSFLVAVVLGLGTLSAQDAATSSRSAPSKAAEPVSSALAQDQEEPSIGAANDLEIGAVDLYSCPNNCTLNQNSLVGTPAGCEPAGPPPCTSASYSCTCAGGVVKDFTQKL